MNRDQKTALVEELSEQIRGAEAIFAVDYRGISVAEAAALRGRLRDADTRLRIVKNSLTERASDQAGVEELKTVLEGPTALAFVNGDAALAARALSDAARTLGTLAFKGGMLNGSVLTAEQVQSIARLPTRDVLNGQLVGTIAAPLTQLVRTLNALISGLAVQLQQVADRGLVAGEAASQAEAGEAAAADGGEAAAADGGEAAAADGREAAEADGGEAAAVDGGEAAAAEVPTESAEEPAAVEEAAAAEEEPAAAVEAPAAAEADVEELAAEPERTESEPASDADASEQ